MAYGKRGLVRKSITTYKPHKKMIGKKEKKEISLSIKGYLSYGAILL